MKRDSVPQEIERLRKEVERLEKHLEALDPSSDEYAKVNRTYLDAHKMINEYEKTYNENDSETSKRWIDLALGVAGLLLPLGFNFIWLLWGFQFEEEGSIKSSMFKWLTSRFTIKK